MDEKIERPKWFKETLGKNEWTKKDEQIGSHGLKPLITSIFEQLGLPSDLGLMVAEFGGPKDSIGHNNHIEQRSWRMKPLDNFTWQTAPIGYFPRFAPWRIRTLDGDSTALFVNPEHAISVKRDREGFYRKTKDARYGRPDWTHPCVWTVDDGQFDSPMQSLIVGIFAQLGLPSNLGIEVAEFGGHGLKSLFVNPKHIAMAKADSKTEIQIWDGSFPMQTFQTNDEPLCVFEPKVLSPQNMPRNPGHQHAIRADANHHHPNHDHIEPFDELHEIAINPPNLDADDQFEVEPVGFDVMNLDGPIFEF